MAQISPSYLQIGATLGMLIMALLAIFIRLKASHRPVTIRKILIPPLGMSTGFLMFVVPETHIPLWWAVIAFLVGWFIFSYPLIRSTRFEKVNEEIFATRSRSFAFILLGLLAVRLILHEVIQQYVTIPQTGGLFFLLAFGMIVRWRVYMYKHYKEVVAASA
ncbi:membrane protein CcdC involved in cytochrome C biogenesis [Paenibacillus sp. PvP094]|uniref:CcdC family protein n=1 Tax=Paenibacillus TaxID=44249 RepID=UPI001649DE6C|nr:cytochrome c biogenesis protein CcdC [Paenibacillus xylanexedens]